RQLYSYGPVFVLKIHAQSRIRNRIDKFQVVLELVSKSAYRTILNSEKLRIQSVSGIFQTNFRGESPELFSKSHGCRMIGFKSGQVKLLPHLIKSRCKSGKI